MAKAIMDWIDDCEDWQKELVIELRNLILATVPEADEALKWGQPCYSRNHLFCYLQRSKSAVTLGFQKGAQIADPASVLQGRGKQMRHIKYALGDKVDRVSCKALIDEAIRLDSPTADI